MFNFGIKEKKKEEKTKEGVFGFGVKKSNVSEPKIKIMPKTGAGGGGAFWQGKPGELINKGHATYGGVGTKAGYQRDDIFPVSLGGANESAENIRLVKTKDNPADFETKIAKDYKDGKLTLGQARMAVLIKKQEYLDKEAGVSQETLDNLPKAITETLGKAGKTIAIFFTGSTQALGKTLGQAAFSFTKEKKELDKLLGEGKISIEEYSDITGADKTPKQIYGQGFGTLLETLSFGTFGKATQGMKTFGLSKAAPSVLQGFTAKELSKLPIKEATKKIIKESVNEALKIGAPLGAGFGASSAMQQNEDGKSILKEMLMGGAIGAGLQFTLSFGGRFLSMASEKAGPLGKDKGINNKIDPSIRYVPKKNLGVDKDGEKLLSKLETNKQTGEKTIFYDELLDKKPQKKAEVIDNIHGKIIDEKLGVKAEITPKENILVRSLDDFAESQGKSTAQISNQITRELRNVKGDSFSDKFNNAVLKYKESPKIVKSQMPTLTAIIEYKPNPALARNVISENTLIREAFEIPPTSKEKIVLEQISSKIRKEAEGMIDNTAPKIDTKISKIGKSIETKTIEKGLTKGFKDLAEYNPITIKEQAEKISTLINDDFDNVSQIIRGKKPVPEGISGTYLIKAVEDFAQSKGDIKTLMDISKSPLTSETSRYAQELRMAAEREPDSAAVKIKEVREAKKQYLEEKSGKKIKEIEKEEIKKIKKEIKKKTPNKDAWVDFINEITC